jgi:basic membrane protein A
MAAAAVFALALAIVAASGAGPRQGAITAALISDVGKFNDKSFNQSQLAGLNRAKKALGVTAVPLQSNAVSDYIPNLRQAVLQRQADITISEGFLLADATATMAKAFPNSKFAITDYSVYGAPFADKKAKPLYKNVMGLTYAANESGCLVGVLAAKAAQRMGGNVVGAVGGIKIPSVDIWIAGYKSCAMKAVPGTQVLVNYSQDFVAVDKCKTQAENLIARGAKVLFQVAGGCGLGTLKAADEAGLWGIGVDIDQYNFAKRVLTSGIKRVDVGIYSVIKQVVDGKYKGGTDLNFTLKNGGMGVGKINPSVPKSDIALMNAYKKRIINGTLKVPTALT